MAYWMRMTSDGVGIHTGDVIPGQRLSHGCIHMHVSAARTLFNILRVGSYVTIHEDVEPGFPALSLLEERARQIATLKATMQTTARTIPGDFLCPPGTPGISSSGECPPPQASQDSKTELPTYSADGCLTPAQAMMRWHMQTAANRAAEEILRAPTQTEAP